MEDKKIVAIECSDDVSLFNLNKILNFREGFTTNKNYRGHTFEGIPVYINRLLKQGEIKQIMSGEFKTLNEGRYQAKVEQVIRKHGKDASGNEDASKEIISIELNVKGEDAFYYLTYCVKGYSDLQMEIANENLNRLMEDFNVQIVEELAGKIGTLISKKNEKGFINLTLYPNKEFFDWSKVLQFDCEAKFNCEVLNVRKNKYNNKRTFKVKANVNGNEVEEFIVYDLDNEYKQQSYEWLEDKFKFEDEEIEESLDLNEKALLIVKRVTKDGVVYFNKRLGFEKKAPRKPKAW